MDKKTVGYWLATGLFCLVLGFSGFAHSTRLSDMVESMTALGYPVYFMTILGIAKILGVLALLAPALPLLKEWAYAGFSFNLLGATATHLFVGDPLAETLPPAILLLIGATSYLLRPTSRRLAQSPSLGAAAPDGQAVLS